MILSSLIPRCVVPLNHLRLVTDKFSLHLGIAYFDFRDQVKIDAVFSMLKTAFIMVVLVGYSVVSTSDAQLLCIGPIERM